MEPPRMRGRRVPDETEPHTYAPGDYGRWRGEWWFLSPIEPPPEHALGRLKNHTVEEHADGTITVSPSILQKYGKGGVVFHGWLRAGVWTRA